MAIDRPREGGSLWDMKWRDTAEVLQQKFDSRLFPDRECLAYEEEERMLQEYEEQADRLLQQQLSFFV